MLFFNLDKYMSDILYISRRCTHCQELLILIHKNKKDLGKLFTIIDVDVSPFPKFVRSVPHLVYKGTAVLGNDIKSQLNMYLSEINNERDTMPPLEYSTMPKMSTTTDIYSNKNNMPSDMPYNKGNVRIEETQTKKNTEEYDGTIQNELESYCVDGVCGLSFSSIDDTHIDNSVYDPVDFGDEENQTNLHVNSDNPSINKSYEQMMSERDMDMNPNNNKKMGSMDYQSNTLDLRV